MKKFLCTVLDATAALPCGRSSNCLYKDSNLANGLDLDHYSL